jgi:hypothetical protein
LSPESFSTWAPQIIGMIGKPDGTILDRSVCLRLQRSPTAIATLKVPIDLFERNVDLRRKLKKWSKDHNYSLRCSKPAIPEISNARAMDNWGPLLSIADELGSDWPVFAREAMLALEGDDSDSDESVGVMLLQDIQKAFSDSGMERMHTSKLIELLVADEERPWRENARGKPITARALSNQLRLFQIKSTQMKIGRINKNGYLLANFEDAFKSYIPSQVEDDPAALQPSEDEI